MIFQQETHTGQHTAALSAGGRPDRRLSRATTWMRAVLMSGCVAGITLAAAGSAVAAMPQEQVPANAAAAQKLGFGPKPAPAPNVAPGTKTEEQNAQYATLKAQNSFDSMSSGDMTPNYANPQRYQISTTATYVNMRGVKNGITAGEGRNLWGFDVSPDHPDTDGNWYFGWLAGSSTTGRVDHCLWSGTASLNPTNGTPTGNCGGVADMHQPDYVGTWNGNVTSGPNQNCFPDPSNPNAYKCDGTPITVDPSKCPYGMDVYANVQPWKQAAIGSSDYRGEKVFTVPAGATVKWRYVTKDYRHVMLDYQGSRPIGQNWGFGWGECFNFNGYYYQWADPSR